MDKSIFGGPFEKRMLDKPHRADDKKYYQWGGQGSKLIQEQCYIKNDTLRILAQSNCFGTNLVQRNLLISDDEEGKINSEHHKAFFQIGTNSGGDDMDDDNHLFAAPCPPYCGGGKTIKL